MPIASNEIHLSVTGPADLVGVDNGDATDVGSFQSPDKKAFHGLLMAIVRTRAAQPDAITLKAEAKGLPSAQASLSSQ